MVHFSSEITAQALVSFVVGAVSGAGGFAGLKAYFVRARLRYTTNAIDLVNSTDPNHRSAVEKVLTSQGIATSLTEIRWINLGRRSAKDVVIEVLIPTGFSGYRMSPVDPKSLLASWSIDESESEDGHRLGLRQDVLLPHVPCRLVIEHASGGTPVTTKFIYRDEVLRESSEADSASIPVVEMAGVAIFCTIATLITAFLNLDEFVIGAGVGGMAALWGGVFAYGVLRFIAPRR